MRSDLTIEQLEIATLSPHPDNPRVHPKAQVLRLTESIRAFGFRVPVLVDQDNRLICGHARVEACERLGMTHVPAIRVSDLKDAQIRALMIADNRLTEISTWDDRLLGENLKILSDMDLSFDIECLGFDYGEIEQRLLDLEAIDADADEAGDRLPDPDDIPTITRPGDLWVLDAGNAGNRILCADSTTPESYGLLLGDQLAAMVFTDPPYNLPARTIGRVCADQHGDFEMAAGEMSPEQFTGFLGSVMQQLCAFSEPGSIHYLFMDWRHAGEMLDAGRTYYSTLKNICVWVKDRPGMGAFYRSQHELVFAFKHGDAKHRNHFGLGEHGRVRSNVWSYPSVRSLESEDGDPSSDALQLHPTIKPVRLIEEAIMDCSRRGEIILDPFLGSGSMLIASEKAQRVCMGIELSPRYVDVAVARWQQWTGREAVHEKTGLTFPEMKSRRRDASLSMEGITDA